MHHVAVDGFWMDEHAVTAADFRRFVRETGYVTVAERPLDPDDYPDADPELLVPGSLVFGKTRGPVNLDDFRNWWAYVPGASWKRPGGAGHDDQRPRPPSGRPGRLRGRRGIRDLGRQGASHRSRVGVRGARRARRRRVRLGRRPSSRKGRPMANTWQGEFPWQNLKLDGYEGTAPVGSLPAQRLRPLRHDRKRLGVDLGLVRADAIPTRRRARAASRATRASAHPTRASGQDSRARTFRGR